MSNYAHIVTSEESGMQLKSVIKKSYRFSSRLMSKLKRLDLIFVNGEKMPGWVQVFEGDVIEVEMPEEQSDFDPEDIPIEVVYEDDDILVINKQPGFAVHPTKGKPFHTIANGIQKKINDEGSSYKIRFANRLDMNTSGLLIVAKNSNAQDNLVRQMGNNLVEKIYVAIVEGEIEEDYGTIDKPIGRPDPDEVERWILPEEKGGYPSVTHYRVLERFNGYSLIKLKLDTGRTHQIRVHMAAQGNPIIGDHLYCHGDPFEYRRIHGDPRMSKEEYAALGKDRPETNPEIVSEFISRQALHAKSLSFNHPVTGKRIELDTDLPEDMKDAITRIKKINSK